jgi:hypothetical protein
MAFPIPNPERNKAKLLIVPVVTPDVKDLFPPSGGEEGVGQGTAGGENDRSTIGVGDDLKRWPRRGLSQSTKLSQPADLT